MPATSLNLGSANDELRLRARSSLPMHLVLIVVFYALTGIGAAWIGPMALLTAVRFKILTGYPGFSASDSEHRAWRRRFKLGAYVCALVWASLAGYTVLNGGQSWSSLLLFLIMSGISSGGVTSLAPDYYLARNFVLLLNFPPFVVGIFSGTWSAVILLALYQIFLVRQGRQQYEWFWKGYQDNYQLGLANAALKEAERVRNELFATASHELRTPLTLILGPLDSLRQTPLDPAQKALVETMGRNGQHLLNMVNELLDFTKLDAHKFEVRRRGIRVDTLCRGVFEAFLPSAEAAGQVWSAQLEGQSEARSLDPAMVERILFNLLSNALKFTRSGGTVSLSLESQGDRLALIVADSGGGIAEADLARVFAQFEQAGNSPHRRYEGTGLGLAIVKQFCQLLGGDVSVTSQVGVGSVFRAEVLAPICDERESGPLPRVGLADHLPKAILEDAPAPASEDSLPLVLLVEDNDELAHYMAEALRPFALVERAFDGVDGLERARELRPCLVITDVMMPRMDGLELCRRLKQDQVFADVPIMVLTAAARQETMLEAWRAGADEFLMKPFHPLELATRTRGFLKARSDREAADGERRRLELELRQAEKRAALQKMGGGVAHTFNNLLTAAFGSLELARMTPGLPSPALAHLDEVEQALKGVAGTTQTLSLYLNSWPRQLELLDLAEVCSGDWEMELERSLEPAPLMGHREQLRMLVQALLENAREACEEQPAQILLATGCRQVAADDILDLQEGFWSFLKVRDQGCGMDEETRRRMLDPFFSTKFTGRGLGLSVLAGLLQSHKAVLEVDTVPGQGTTVWVFFPQPPRPE